MESIRSFEGVLASRVASILLAVSVAMAGGCESKASILERCMVAEMGDEIDPVKFCERFRALAMVECFPLSDHTDGYFYVGVVDVDELIRGVKKEICGLRE